MHIFNSQWPSLLAFRVQHDHAKTDRDTHIANANKSLASTVEPARLRRADLKCMEEKVREIWDGLEKVRKANEKCKPHFTTSATPFPSSSLSNDRVSTLNSIMKLGRNFGTSARHLPIERPCCPSPPRPVLTHTSTHILHHRLWRLHPIHKPHKLSVLFGRGGCQALQVQHHIPLHPLDPYQVLGLCILSLRLHLYLNQFVLSYLHLSHLLIHPPVRRCRPPQEHLSSSEGSVMGLWSQLIRLVLTPILLGTSKRRHFN